MTVKHGIAAMSMVLASAAQAAKVHLYTEEYPPFNWTDQASGKVVGIAADIVKTLFERSAVAATGADLVPWARAYSTTLATPNSCLFSTARIAEREQQFSWVGPIGHNEVVMFARRADHVVLPDIDAARPYRVGSYFADATVEFLKERKFTLDIAPAARFNPQKLLMHRIDLWATGRLPGLFLLRQMGITDIEPVLRYDSADLYLACHRSLDGAILARLNATLKLMTHDGTLARIYAHYGFEGELPAFAAAPK